MPRWDLPGWLSSPRWRWFPESPLAQDAGPTFHKDVEPILQRSCQVCHRPDNMAPMSLMNYQETRPWARSIKNKVVAREMPPWHVDKNVGIQEFKQDRSLSNAEIELVAAWVDAGAPRGNPADAPPPVVQPDFGAWEVPPDVIVTSPPHTVPAEAGDWWGDYIVDSGIAEDRFIKSIQTRAGDLRVVHHALTYAVTDPEAPADDNSNDFFLNEYAVGKNADKYPEGTGKLFEADARVRFSFHYHSIGEEVVDRTELGMVLYPEDEQPDKILYSRQLGQAGELDIPAGQVTRHDGYATMYLPGKLTGFQPHMHFLGKRQCLELIYPDSSTEMINCVNFDFNWHIVYNYADEVQPVYPAGDEAARHQLPRQHRGASREPGSAELDGRRQPDDRRDGLRLDQLVRPDRRGVREGARRSLGERQRLAPVLEPPVTADSAGAQQHEALCGATFPQGASFVWGESTMRVRSRRARSRGRWRGCCSGRSPPPRRRSIPATCRSSPSRSSASIPGRTSSRSSKAGPATRTAASCCTSAT